VSSPEPPLTLMVRVSPGVTPCMFGGRRWSIEWAGGGAPMKLTTLQTMRDFASGAEDPRVGTRRLTMHANLGKKVSVRSELGPHRSKLTFTLQAQVGDAPAPRVAPRSTNTAPRGVIIFHDQVLCANEFPDMPGVVPDWRAVDEEAYANPTTSLHVAAVKPA
jgi:hypothetical protein